MIGIILLLNSGMRYIAIVFILLANSLPAQNYRAYVYR